MKSKEYWLKRASARRMYRYQSMADAAGDDIASIYIKAANEIEEEIGHIFRTFQINGGLSDREARELLNSKQTNNLRELVGSVKDPALRQNLLNIVNAPAYAWRIKRYEQLQEEIDRYTDMLADKEVKRTRAHYVELADEAYLRTVFDIQRGTGIGFSFSMLPEKKITQILNQNWSGKLFSERIWGRAEEVNTKLKDELSIGFLTGRSYRKTAEAIESRLAVGAMEARRLVRTESTYIANMAEIESYRECEIDRYEYLATLDMRTSNLCAAMDGRIFEVEKAIPGETTPPLHPWCRSSTLAVIDRVTETNLKRRARDPETGKTYMVSADTKYSEWKKGLTKEADGGIIKVHYGAYTDISDPLGKKRDLVAADYYDQIRHRKRSYEISVVANNTGFSKEDIDKVFAHVFELEHRFEDGTIKRFTPDYYMMHSWIRLREGKNIQAHDITMLRHELAEAILMESGTDVVYEKAHEKVQKVYNYKKELLEYLKEHDA